MSAIGWALHVARCKHLEQGAGSPVLSVNFVMPGGHRTNDSWIPGDPPLPPSEDNPPWAIGYAQSAMGDLLFPWKLESIANWLLVGFDIDGNNSNARQWPVSASPGLASQVQPELRDKLLSSIEREIINHTNECDYPMSTLPKFALAEDGKSSLADKQKMSLPHVIAPLTHLPAAIANACLKMAQFVELPSLVYDDIKADEDIVFFALFPTITIAGVTLSFTSFHLDPHSQQRLATANYDPHNGHSVSLLQLAIDRTSLLAAKTNNDVTTIISSHDRHDFTLEDELRTYLHPLQLFAGTLLDVKPEPVLDADLLKQLQVQLVKRKSVV